MCTTRRRTPGEVETEQVDFSKTLAGHPDNVSEDSVRFSESEIDAAMHLRAAGLVWGPEPGHYVFDINGIVRAGSPFQAGIFLIHSPNTFEILAGGQDEMLENFVWLPTWEDCRTWLTEKQVADDRVQSAWQSGRAQGLTDRQVLYGLILEVLERSAAAE